MDDPLHLRLAGVTRLAILGRRGPLDGFVFDPHRLALPCWALGLGDGPPALLVTLDRHLDLVPPGEPKQVPDRSRGVRELDEYARWQLDVRNVDHVLAAMEAGLVSDAVVIARARPPGALTGDTYVDSRGRPHQIAVAATVDEAAQAFLAKERIHALFEGASACLLDLDLDCFTTPSDADPTTVLPWPDAVVRQFLLPEGSEPFWDAVLARARVLTLAREPFHCGGLVCAGQLFADLAPVLFEGLLGADVP